MNWVPIFTIGVGILGSALVILPTFPYIQTRINDQYAIQKLQHGRRKLSNEGNLFEDDPSFPRIREVVEKHWDQDLSDECYGFHRPKLVYTVAGGDETYDHILTVYSVDSDAADEEEPNPDHYLQDIESIMAIDSWIEFEIERLRTVRIQRIRGVGFALMVASVLTEGGVSLL